MFRIVLGEDNPADAQMLKIALQQTCTSVEITVFQDGVRLIEYLTAERERNAKSPCDLVLLDLNLPKLTGFEILKEMRAREELKSLPIIVMSSSIDPADIDRSYQLGANSYICKRAHLDEILTMGVQFVTYWAKCAQLPSGLNTRAAHTPLHPNLH